MRSNCHYTKATRHDNTKNRNSYHNNIIKKNLVFVSSYKTCFANHYCLYTQMRRQLLHRVRHHLSRSVSLDPFPCRVSVVVPSYATPLYDSKSLVMDGLLVDWVHKLQCHGCGRGILICPAWPLLLWWEQLSRMPGLHFHLPPARFVVVPNHSSKYKVEPFLNHSIVLGAVIMTVFMETSLM